MDVTVEFPATVASVGTTIGCYLTNLGCFCAGTLVLASKGLQPIETIQLGRRVITSKGDSSGPSIDPEKTRLIRLSFVKDGQEIRMSFLRPAKAVEGLSAGDTMNIEVMELAVHGRARVLAVEPCPPIEEGPGSIVTGAFNSETVDLYKLKLQGLDQPIEVTGNHPIFSEDRHDFVPANSLSEGELLRARAGVAIVESIERKVGQWTVYNLEVNEAHRYYITEKHVLVHNACDDEEFGGFEAMAGGDNTAANRAFQYVADELGLNPDQVEELHDMITGEGMSMQEIMELAKSWFFGE